MKWLLARVVETGKVLGQRPRAKIERERLRLRTSINIVERGDACMTQKNNGEMIDGRRMTLLS
jgi:hypothetical protein